MDYLARLADIRIYEFAPFGSNVRQPESARLQGVSSRGEVQSGVVSMS